MNQQKPETAEADELRGQIKSWEVLYDSSLADRLVLLAGLAKVKAERNVLRGDLAHAEDEIDGLFAALVQVEFERDALRKETEELRGLLIRCREFAIEAIQDRIKISGVDPAKHGLVRMIDAATKPSPKEGP
jgi:hypothetical protein